MRDVLFAVGVVIAGFVVIYLFIAFTVAIDRAVRQDNACTYQSGTWSQKRTGKRWEADPLTLGTTGRCIENPEAKS